jgi:hypothetical protein
MTHRNLVRASASDRLGLMLGRAARAGQLLLAALFVLVCVLTSLARADETSGTWTGELEGRGNYYLEKSTRVMVPTVRVGLEAPNGVRLQASYLVDVISSASIGQTGGAKDGVFTELRHGIGVRTGKLFTVGDNELDLSAHGAFSTEDDYKSWLYGLFGSFAWDEKNNTISLGLTRVDDTITSNIDPKFQRKLGGLTTSLGYSRVLSPTLTLGLGYQIVFLEGFLGNAYRRALVDGHAPDREAPPEERTRHNIEAQLAWFLPASRTTLQLYGRLYVDNWSMTAITPELRIYQQLGDLLGMRLRYRYYDQSATDFALNPGMAKYMMGYTGPTTSDPKLSAFYSHQVGARFDLSLRFLQGVVDFLARGSLDVSLDYQYCTSAFGWNWFGTLGGVLPF